MSKDGDARREMARLNPRGSIPTFLIDGKVMIGFSPRALRRKIDEAASRRRR